MTPPFHRTLSLFAALAFIFIIESSSVYAADHREAPIIWGVATSQTFRACLNGPTRTSRGEDEVPTEIVSMNLSGSSGISFLEQDLEVSAGEFQCFDFSYSVLAEALRESGGDPDPTTDALTFKIDFRRAAKGRGSATNINGMTLNAMNLNSLNGKIENYATITLKTVPVNK